MSFVGALIVLLVAAPTAIAAPETFTVSNAADTGAGSLRQAILGANANNNIDIDQIEFSPAVVGQTIGVATGLPTIEEQVTINGCSTNPGATAPCAGLRYTGALTGTMKPHGIDINVSLVTVRGLAITNFGFGIAAGFAPIVLVIANDWVGVRLDGTAESNAATGIASGADSTIIGGSTASDDNVIASSGTAGIALNGADNSTIKGNRIGVDAAGNPRGNTGTGIRLQSLGTNPVENATIGGNTAGEENLISNNGGDAISINGGAFDDGADNNVILRNRGSENAGLFIDLEPLDGVGNSGLGPNAGLQAPAIDAATSESASGTAEPGATVRLFRRATSNLGRIDEFAGQATADGAGNWAIAYPPLPSTGFATATQTVSGTGTSELSANLAYIDVTPRPTTAVQSPAATPAAAPTKKCKKGRKLKRGKCVRKKRKKKR